MGCNVLDTAPHYHGGAHELAVGEAIRTAMLGGTCQRDALVVNTKVGKVLDLIEHNPRKLGFGRCKALIEERYVARGLFGWHEVAAGIHTFAPAFIRYSLAASLERLSLEQVDCVFLDSPELQRTSVSSTEYDRRLRAAFETLEEVCELGQARAYGIATASELDLDALMSIARDVAGSDPRLRALRVPLSLLRPGLLDLARRAADAGLYVFASGCVDGGAPGYQLPAELDASLGHLSDPSAAVRWATSAPHVGTALVGSRDIRHIRQNLSAAAMPHIDAGFYSIEYGETA